MKVGLVISGHLAAHAITTACKGAGHEIHTIDAKTTDASTCGDLETIVVATARNIGFMRSLLSSIAPECHLVYVSSYAVLPSRPVAVPWGEDAFDVTGELLPGQGTSQVAREAERLLLVGGGTHHWTILRPAIIEGLHDLNPAHTRWFVDRILSGEPVCLPDSDEQPYRHLSTRDLASAVVTILGQAKAYHRVLHVCSDGVLTPSLHASAVATALGRELELRFVPDNAWDAAGLLRPMAGRSGAALLASSPILRELGWVPASPARFLTNLSREQAEQPRRVEKSIRALELALLRPRTSAVSAFRESSGWMLQAVSRGGPAITVVRSETASSGPWKTVAVALGEEVERTVSAIGAMGIEQSLSAPLLARKARSRHDVLAFGRNARDAIADSDDLVPVPPGLGLSALLAAPLARLLDVWPADAPSGEVWILGRGVEALLASWLALDDSRTSAILSLAGEDPNRTDGLLVEALHQGRKGSPAIVINVSAVPEGEALAADKLLPDGVLITPFLPSVPIPKRRRLVLLPDQPPHALLKRAFELLHKWHDRLAANNCLSLVHLQDASGALAGPILSLPILVTREIT